MYFLPRRLWFRVIGSCGVISVALFYVLSPRQPVTSFYLLHTRAWELAMGSVGALGGFTFARTSRIPFRAALAILVMIPVLPLTVLSPRWHALLICSATLVVLLANDAAVATSRAARLLAAVGDCSYSVYLVHWPLLAFANNCWVRPVPTAVRIALLVTALPLGYGLYRFVERPLWRAPLQFSARSARVIAAASLILAMAAGLVGWVHRPSADYTAVRRANYGLSEACAFVSTFRPLPECRTSPSPRMGVWGDSFAMHLVPGIVATTDVGVVQATRSSCGPFVDVAPFDDTDITIGWAKECIAFNDSVIEYLEGASSIQTVVLASPFRHYVDGAAAPQPYRLLHRRGGSYTVGDGGVTEALRAMKATVARIRALGKRVVVVAPPPADGETNIAECLERRALGLPVFGTAHSDCSLSVLSYRRHASRVLDFLARLPEESGVGVFSFDSFLCSAESCATTRDGKFLYRDGTHLSYEGSVLLATRLRLSERLIALAR
jgi:hypothetical protein